MPERITRHDAGGVCTLTLNRPEKLNALDTASFRELEAYLEDLHRDEGKVGCVVIRGALGLVDLTAPPGKLDEVLGSFVTELLANSWFTNFATKRLLIETDGMSLRDGLAHAYYHYPGNAPDHHERIAAFKRVKES
jgi:enoyl-CoA hydratase/carnithine racemase